MYYATFWQSAKIAGNRFNRWLIFYFSFFLFLSLYNYILFFLEKVKVNPSFLAGIIILSITTFIDIFAITFLFIKLKKEKFNLYKNKKFLLWFVGILFFLYLINTVVSIISCWKTTINEPRSLSFFMMSFFWILLLTYLTCLFIFFSIKNSKNLNNLDGRVINIQRSHKNPKKIKNTKSNYDYWNTNEIIYKDDGNKIAFIGIYMENISLKIMTIYFI